MWRTNGEAHLRVMPPVPVFPLLFDAVADPSRKPTTRDIANTVKTGGTAALVDAERRADEARYQEVSCRSALNRVTGMPFRWTLNPYRGCTHGCHYCFARRYHVQFEMNADDDFASVILVKKNLVEILTGELARASWKREVVAVGTATDPYQPIEGHYRLTRRALEALARARTPVGLVTKGPMVVRDIDILKDVGRAAACTVYMSVPTVDDAAWRTLEPGTAHPLQRLRAVRELVAAGVNAGVLMAPIVPGFSSARSKLEATVKAIADHGARFVGCNEFPTMLPRFERLYRGHKYPPDEYRKEIQAMVKVLQSRYSLTGREEASRQPAQPSESGQIGFRW
jgi:DNA repair photolyase